jgi:hypothetical protein
VGRDAEGDIGCLDPVQVVGGHAAAGEALDRDQPAIPSVNPVVTVMIVAERAACLIRQDR